MHVVLHYAIVENAVALVQVVSLLTIHDLYFALHHVYKLLALVSAKLEFGSVLWVYVNHKWLHVASSLLLSQWVILHVFASISSIIAEANAAVSLTILSTSHDRTQVVVVIHECTQSYAQCASDFNQRTK